MFDNTAQTVEKPVLYHITHFLNVTWMDYTEKYGCENIWWATFIGMKGRIDDVS